MEFSIINSTQEEIPETLLHNCAHLLLDAELPEQDLDLGLLICDDDAMQDYNRRYRGDAGITDVLSFTDLDQSPDSVLAGVLPPSADIIIDINQLDRQKGNKSREDELLRVFIHGLLHACGYDHIRAGDREVMEFKERYYRQLMDGRHRRG